MQFLKNFKLKRFVLVLLSIAFLTFISFLFTFSADEGYPNNFFLFKLLEYSFFIFRFPTHVFFWNYMDGDWYLYGLLINVIFYSLLIELTIMLIKTLKRKRVE